jgi:TonB family protein
MRRHISDAIPYGRSLPIRGSLVKMLLPCLLVLLCASRSSYALQTNGSSSSRQKADVTPAKLITKTEPKYPDEARRKGVSGTVRVHALISKDGSLSHIKVISGDPLLTQAAIDAVQQWRYTPCLLNGTPVEIDTTIDVNFELSKKSQEPKSTQ